jgi:hypothetical protein
MASAQQLLIRSIIAAMWKAPYTRKLVRWGTQLHDRFMLPFLSALKRPDRISTGEFHTQNLRPGLSVVIYNTLILYTFYE